MLQHIGVLLAHPLAQLPKVVGQSRIDAGSGNGGGEGILCRLQIGGGALPILQLLISGRPCQKITAHCRLSGLTVAGRQQGNSPRQKPSSDCFGLWATPSRATPYSSLATIARHAFAGGSIFSRIEFRLANRNCFCILCLQQTARTSDAPLPPCGPYRQQKGKSAERGSTSEKWQPQSPG